jgi:hypothetical protein
VVNLYRYATVKTVDVRTPHPNWPAGKTPHGTEDGKSKKSRGGVSGAAARKAGEEARRRALALEDSLSGSDVDDVEDESDGDEEGDFVSLASHQRKTKVVIDDAEEEEAEEEEAEEAAEEEAEEEEEEELDCMDDGDCAIRGGGE